MTRHGTESPFGEGVRHAGGIPSLVLAAGYIGFGALAAGNGLSFAGTMFATVFIWALPGQLIAGGTRVITWLLIQPILPLVLITW